MGALPIGDPLKRSGGRALRRDDDGQLMMLAGIVLTISFIVTALTMSQVASLEKEAAQDRAPAILNEWRFLTDRLASGLRTSVTAETSNHSFDTTMLPALRATYRALGAERGYDFLIRMAGDASYADNGNEAGLIVADRYATWSRDGAVNYNAVPRDPVTTDGVIWETPCPDAVGPAAGCIGGLYLFLRLADATTTMEESVLFAVNHG